MLNLAPVALALRGLGGGRAAPHAMAAALDAMLAAAASHARPYLLLLPTTHDAVAWAQRHASPTRWLVAERRHVAGASSPSRYLAECRRRRAQGIAPPGALLFSDQFVEAPHAVLLVEWAGGQRYLSAIEVVAHATHGVDVHAWTGDAPVVLAAVDGIDVAARVLRTQAAYLDACDGLGEAWLARHAQRLREPAMRVRAAIHRIRRYESYLLQAYADSAMDRSSRDVLHGLGARRRRLLASLRAQAC